MASKDEIQKGPPTGYARNPRKGEIKFYRALLDDFDKEINDYYLRKVFGLSPDTISRHFDLMSKKGYLEVRQTDRSTFYKLTAEGYKHCLNRIELFPGYEKIIPSHLMDRLKLKMAADAIKHGLIEVKDQTNSELGRSANIAISMSEIVKDFYNLLSTPRALNAIKEVK